MCSCMQTEPIKPAHAVHHCTDAGMALHDVPTWSIARREQIH